MNRKCLSGEHLTSRDIMIYIPNGSVASLPRDAIRNVSDKVVRGIDYSIDCIFTQSTIDRNKRTLALTSVLFAITKFPYISDVLIATIIHQHHTVMCTTSLAPSIDNSPSLSHSLDYNIAQNEICCKL